MIIHNLREQALPGRENPVVLDIGRGSQKNLSCAMHSMAANIQSRNSGESLLTTGPDDA